MTIIYDKKGVPIEVYGMKIHPIANEVPLADEREQLALQEGIREQGQKQPIILYRKRIVDGRCRSTACENLGIEVVKDKLPNNWTEKQVRDEIRETNNRRNLLPAQKAIIAYEFWKENSGMTQEEAGIKKGVATRSIGAAKDIAEHEPDILKELKEGLLIPIGDNKKSRSIQTVQKYLKHTREQRERTLKADNIVMTYGTPEAYEKLLEEEKRWVDLFLEAVGDKKAGGYNHRLKTLLAQIAPDHTKEVSPLEQLKIAGVKPMNSEEGELR